MQSVRVQHEQWATERYGEVYPRKGKGVRTRVGHGRQTGMGRAALSERAREETRDKVAAWPFYSQAHTWQQVMKSQVAKQTRGSHFCVTTETSTSAPLMENYQDIFFLPLESLGLKEQVRFVKMNLSTMHGPQCRHPCSPLLSP